MTGQIRVMISFLGRAVPIFTYTALCNATHLLRKWPNFVASAGPAGLEPREVNFVLLDFRQDTARCFKGLKGLCLQRFWHRAIKTNVLIFHRVISWKDTTDAPLNY